MLFTDDTLSPHGCPRGWGGPDRASECENRRPESEERSELLIYVSISAFSRLLHLGLFLYFPQRVFQVITVTNFITAE